MVSLLKSIAHSLGMFYSLLGVSFFFLVLSFVGYYYSHRKMSFFFFYIALTYSYFFILLTVNVSAITVTYIYYGFLFFSYHIFFTFSKRFCIRTIVVIRKYLHGSEYFKLFLWSILIFLTALFGETFIFLIVFNPLFGFSLVIGDFKVFLFLFFLWLWIFFIIMSNTFKLFDSFLFKILNYFSRGACLHFVGNQLGRYLCEKIGPALVCTTPVIVGIPAAAGYALDQEAKTGQYAIERMHNYQDKYPNATDDQKYQVYKTSYESHANSNMIGRGLTKVGIMRPGAPETVISDYKSNLRISLDNLDKK